MTGSQYFIIIDIQSIPCRTTKRTRVASNNILSQKLTCLERLARNRGLAKTTSAVAFAIDVISQFGNRTQIFFIHNDNVELIVGIKYRLISACVIVLIDTLFINIKDLIKLVLFSCPLASASVSFFIKRFE